MSRWIRVLGPSALGLLLWAGVAGAEIIVERNSSENPMVEVYRSTAYGALAGAVVGGAIALSTDDIDHDWNAVRWGTVVGTFAGLATGIYFATTRPQAQAMLDLREGELRVHALPTIDTDASGAVRVHLVGVGF